MKEHAIYIVFAHINEVIPCEYLCDEEVKWSFTTEYQRKKRKSRRMAFFLLNQLFNKANLDSSQLNNIQRTENGRPFILNKNVDFNISHSGEYVAIILSFSHKKIAVGIDIEHPQRIRNFRKLVDYYANQEEIDFFKKNGYSAEYFYLSWCLRESILKAKGAGLVKLSEVEHFPQEKIIKSIYCPKGIFHFYSQLPFYLGYFFEQNSVLSKPYIFQYSGGNLQKIPDLIPLIYQVN